MHRERTSTNLGLVYASIFSKLIFPLKKIQSKCKIMYPNISSNKIFQKMLQIIDTWILDISKLSYIALSSIQSICFIIKLFNPFIFLRVHLWLDDIENLSNYLQNFEKLLWLSICNNCFIPVFRLQHIYVSAFLHTYIYISSHEIKII